MTPTSFILEFAALGLGFLALWFSLALWFMLRSGRFPLHPTYAELLLDQAEPEARAFFATTDLQAGPAGLHPVTFVTVPELKNYNLERDYLSEDRTIVLAAMWLRRRRRKASAHALITYFKDGVAVMTSTPHPSLPLDRPEWLIKTTAPPYADFASFVRLHADQIRQQAVRSGIALAVLPSDLISFKETVNQRLWEHQAAAGLVRADRTRGTWNITLRLVFRILRARFRLGPRPAGTPRL